MSNSEALPASWVECALGDVFEYGSTQKVEPSEISRDAWVLELEDVESETSSVLQRLTFAERQSKSTKNRFRAGDVLYGKLRPYLNKVVRADGDGFCTTEIVPISPPDGVDGGFLFYWLRHPRFLSYVNGVSHGLSMPRLGTDAGKQAPFILAPTNEQKRIVAKIEDLATRSRRAKEALDGVRPLLEKLRQSILSAALRGDVSYGWRTANPNVESGESLLARIRGERRACWERSWSGKTKSYSEPTSVESDGLPELPVGWTWASVDELVDGGRPISYGVLKPGPFVADGPFMFRIVDISDGRLVHVGAHRIDPELSEQYSRTILKGNEVVISLVGTIGRTARVDVSCAGHNVHRNLGVLVPGTGVLQGFLELALSAPVAQERIRLAATGGNQPLFNLGDLKAIPIATPPLREQQQILSKLELALASLARIQNAVAEAQDRREKLDRGLLAKAFRGELVPQDSGDEPASVLLERIQTKRVAR